MLGLGARLSKILDPDRPARSRRGANRSRRRLACEALEPRELLTGGPGVDYTLMGGRWDDSRTITYSIAPDGVNWGQGTNNLNATLNAEYGGAGWQKLIAQALQTWAAVTNLNFAQVADGAYAFNSPGVNQGDPKFGDIRFGGYNFGTTSTIAQTYGPPPNGTTGAGDVELNTGFNFAPGTHYDLESILVHEIGHSLGLGESPQPSSVMYSYYRGVRQSLSPYDVEGIQSIYGARSPDGYQVGGRALTPATAVDLTPILNPQDQLGASGMSLDRIGDTEYYSILAPQLTGSTLRIAVGAAGFSLLSPKLTVIDPSTGATLGVDAHPGQAGSIVQVTVPGVQAGHRYLFEVTGANADASSVGSYGIVLGFIGGTPVAPPPDQFAYNNTFATATNLGTNTNPTLGPLTLPKGTDYQVFTFQATNPGVVGVAALGAEIVAEDASGRVLTQGTGVLLGFNESRAARYYVILKSLDGAPVGNYAFCVRTPAGPSPSAAPAASAGSAPTPSTPAYATVEAASNGALPVASKAVTPNGPLARPIRPNQRTPGIGLAG